MPLKSFLINQSKVKGSIIFRIILIATVLLFALPKEIQAQSIPKSEEQIKKGTSGEARALSAKHNLLVLHVSGGTQDKYSAEQYAKMFQIMFNDPERTSYATKVSVLYEESGDDLPTGVYAFINGQTFDKNGGIYAPGDGVFTAPEIVDWIPKITEEYSNALLH